MKKKLEIKSDLKYNELRQYKKMIQDNELDQVKFSMYLDKKQFKARLKYGLVPTATKYGRRYKFKIYLEGIVSKANDIDLIGRLLEWSPSKPILIADILFEKEKQELVKLDNGDLEYHFTFLQY